MPEGPLGGPRPAVRCFIKIDYTFSSKGIIPPAMIPQIENEIVETIGIQMGIIEGGDTVRVSWRTDDILTLSDITDMGEVIRDVIIDVSELEDVTLEDTSVVPV